MLVVGLTGGVGSGKSTVAEELAARGARIIDADVIAREVVAPGTPGFEAVVRAFGAGVVAGSGELNRAALADLVFSDISARATLEEIIHPRVREEAARQVEAARGEADVAVLVVPLFVESGHYRADRLVVVDCDENIAVERLMRRRGWTELQARQRMAAQMSRDDRNNAADYVIDNSGDIEQLKVKIERCWNWLRNGD